ncbi:MAG: arsenate reductase ArsC [Acidimicrobiia bacterium]|nr:MAG: arsenate reductase ArsC [Acidimicrobiia bacterium]
MALPPETQLMIDQAAQRVQRDFDGVFGVETIARFMAESQEMLESRARILTWLPILIERLARDRLQAASRLRTPPRDRKPAVVFLCVHNAGRSQMAAAWARRIGGDAIEVFSGGSDPASEVNPAVVQAMAEEGIDLAGERPLPWTDEVVRAADVVVTMGCGDACPVFPGIRYLDWEITDPAGMTADQVRPIRDEIRDRVSGLLAELGVFEPR